MKKILVTGGAGYIGSVLCTELVKRNTEVHVIDNLSTGYESSVPSKAELHQGDLCDLNFVEKTFAKIKPDSVVHLAAMASVPESVSKPLEYFHNNVGGSLNLLKSMENHKTKSLIFSSTAAVYSGKSKSSKISTEEAPDPQNPYGMSKLIVEQVLERTCAVSKLNAVALRYFNVAGATKDGLIGQRTKGSGHLIKKIAEFLVGKNSQLSVFGNDYDTADGTCIRDYIHVLDLVDIHLKCLEKIENADTGWVGFNKFNCGYGKGYSVLEVIRAMSEVIGKKIDYKIAERRAGDPAQLVAESDLLNLKLQWKPQHDQLTEICGSALLYEQNLVKGTVA